MSGSATHQRTHETPTPALVTVVESEACHFCAEAHRLLADYPVVVERVDLRSRPVAG